jgi:hypothetical protein
VSPHRNRALACLIPGQFIPTVPSVLPCAGSVSISAPLEAMELIS